MKTQGKSVPRLSCLLLCLLCAAMLFGSGCQTTRSSQSDSGKSSNSKNEELASKGALGTAAYWFLEFAPCLFFWK